MCGLAGWLGHTRVSDDVVAAVAAGMRHRGPDGMGVKRFENAGLIHTRLAVIDLSEHGAQPLANEDGTIWVAFNGELYNHHELRNDLRRRGHRFRGSADTEVLPHLYEEYGAEMFERLRGMFAIAIFDAQTDTLVLARDRFGIKPLFYAPGPHDVAFGSEIPTLKLFPGIDLTPDRQAISDYLSVMYVPAPLTLFRGIASLEPGCSLVVRRDRSGVTLSQHEFHRWSYAIDEDLTLDAAAEQADALISQAVRRQLESDVPIGAMLSGGIDSSLLAAAAQEGLDGNLLSYNVRIADAELDETAAATAVAEHLGLEHTTVALTEQPADWDAVSGFLGDLGQPIADPAVFAVAAVSRAMREHVTVALSGDGGDELFGGYRMYWKLGAISRLVRLPTAALTAAGAGLRPLAAAGVVGGTMPSQLQELRGADDTTIIQSLYATINGADHVALARDADSVESPRRLFERIWERTGPRVSRLDRLSSHATEVGIRLQQASWLLFKSDMGSMRESLELRVPLLDEDLADFALSLPHRLRVERRAGKRVLREVASRHLPPAIVSRPKQGFAVPLEHWVDDGFRRAVGEVVLDAGSPLPEYVEPATYQPWLTAYSESRQVEGMPSRALSHRVLMLVALDACLRN